MSYGELVNDITATLGILGFMGTYVLCLSNRMQCDTLRFPSANIVSALLLLLGLDESVSLSYSLALFVWVIISLAGIIRLMLKKAETNARKTDKNWRESPIVR